MIMPHDWRPPTLTTERLVLRPFVEADAKPLFEYAKNPNVTRYTLWDHHKSESESLSFVRDYAQLRYREGTPEPYAITLAAEPAQPIGACGCFWVSQSNHTMELGYWIAEPFWGRGITVEACRAVVDYSFQEIKPRRVQARVIEGNTASSRVLEKLGFQYEGTLRSAQFRRGRFDSVMLFSVLADEWSLSNHHPQTVS